MRAEWEKQQAIILGFPHRFSDWADDMKEFRAAQKAFLKIARLIAKFESVWVLCDERDKKTKEFLENGLQKELKKSKAQILKIKTNDTWVRDFAPIATIKDGKNIALNFGFNGWGLKYAANFDNAVNEKLAKMEKIQNLQTQSMILEGGSIDSNGAGVILTNTQCLLEKNRNPSLSQQQIQEYLLEIFGVEKILWLNNGYLAGDDTDSHIDTLARFINTNTIAYVKCDDKSDEHFLQLQKMEDELKNLRDLNGKAFNLIALPFPKARFLKGDKHRLPASYANFLFVNGALLVPTYKDKKNDKLALEILQNALPKLKVKGIDCTELIKWHGSLHCVSMQVY